MLVLATLTHVTAAPAGAWDGMYFGGSMGSTINADNYVGREMSFPNLNQPSTSGLGATGGRGGDGGTIDGRSDIKDLFSGFYVGNNWQSSNVVTGLEGDIGAYGSINNLLVSFRGRLGIARDRFLLYVTTGLSYISINGGDSAIFVGGKGGNGGNGGDDSRVGLGRSIGGNGGIGGNGFSGGIGGSGGNGGGASGGGIGGNGGNGGDGFSGGIGGSGGNGGGASGGGIGGNGGNGGDGFSGGIGGNGGIGSNGFSGGIGGSGGNGGSASGSGIGCNGSNGGNGFNGGTGGDGGNGGNSFNGGICGNAGMSGIGTPNETLTRDSESKLGLVGGIGSEYAIAPQTTLGIEALYYRFDNLAKAGFEDDFFMLRARLSMGLDEHFGGFSNTSGSANWAGMYIGGHGGMLFSSTDDSIDATRLINGGAGGNGANGSTTSNGGGGGGGGAGGTALALLEQDDMSMLGGLQLGYNWQQDRTVYGVETDGSFGSHNRDYLASLRGKLGWTHGSHLFYLTGGIAATRVDGEFGIFGGDGSNGGNGNNSSGGAGGTGGTAFAVSDTENLVGFAIGAGMDTKLTRDLSFGLEGIYYGFDGDTKNFSDLNINSPGYAFVSQDNDRSTFVVRARLATFF